MSTPFMTEIVGCPIEAFFIITAFWGILICVTLKVNGVSIALTAGLTFLTAWLWGLYGWIILAVVGGIVVVGGIIYWLAQPSYDDEDARIKEYVTIGLVALGVIGVLAWLIYWFVNSDSWADFLSFLPKILAVIGVLGLVALFVWIAYLMSGQRVGGGGGGQGGGGGGGGRQPPEERQEEMAQEDVDYLLENIQDQIQNVEGEVNQNPNDIQNRRRGVPVPDNPNRRR